MIFWTVFQLILKLSHSTPWHQAISRLCFPGRQCCKLQRQAGVSHTSVISSSSDGHRASPCPGSITAGMPKTPPLRNEPGHLLGLPVGPGAIPLGRNLVWGSRRHLSKEKDDFRCRFRHFPCSRGQSVHIPFTPSHQAPPGFSHLCCLRYFRVVRQECPCRQVWVCKVCM